MTSPGDHSGASQLAASRARTAVVWWAIFLAPVILGSAVLLAGIVGDRRTATWVFVVGLVVLVLTVAAGFQPEVRRGRYLVSAMLVAIGSGAVGLGLFLATGTVTDEMNPEPADTTPSAPPPSTSIGAAQSTTATSGTPSAPPTT